MELWRHARRQFVYEYLGTFCQASRLQEIQKAVVIMFIHGGSCDTGGASSVAYYDGTNSVQEAR